MITEKDVLRAIIKCEKPNGGTEYKDIASELNTDVISLHPFLNDLKNKKYINQDLSNVYMTDIGRSVCKEMIPKKIKKSIFDFSKFSLKLFWEIIIGIIVAVVAAYIIYHFGWQ